MLQTRRKGRSKQQQQTGNLDMTNLEQQAMNACKGYMTGYAMPFQEPVIRSLEQQGLVEVISYDPLDGGLYYVAARQSDAS